MRRIAPWLLAGFVAIGAAGVALATTGTAQGASRHVHTRGQAGNARIAMAVGPAPPAPSCARNDPHPGARGSVASVLLQPCDIPAYGPGGGSGWIVAGGAVTESPTCPWNPLLGLAHSGYAAISFEPLSDGAPELYEQVIRTSAAASEFGTLQAELAQCASFREALAPGNFLASQRVTLKGSLASMPVPAFGQQSAGFLQSVPVAMPRVVVPKVEAAFAATYDAHLVAPPRSFRLLTGSILVRQGDYLMLLAYFADTSTFRAGQLDRFVPAALALLHG